MLIKFPLIIVKSGGGAKNRQLKDSEPFHPPLSAHCCFKWGAESRRWNGSWTHTNRFGLQTSILVHGSVHGSPTNQIELQDCGSLPSLAKNTNKSSISGRGYGSSFAILFTVTLKSQQICTYPSALTTSTIGVAQSENWTGSRIPSFSRHCSCASTLLLKAYGTERGLKKWGCSSRLM